VRRRLLRILAAAGIVVAALAVPLAWLAATKSGLEFAWRIASHFTSGIEIQMLDGRLLGPVRATGVTVDLSDLHYAIERLELDWHPWRLVTGTFDVERLAFSGVEVAPRAAGSAAEPADGGSKLRLPTSVALPIDVDVRRATVTR
jgi:autotransporter translocation and assembly factor TamB